MADNLDDLNPPARRFRERVATAEEKYQAAIKREQDAFTEVEEAARRVYINTIHPYREALRAVQEPAKRELDVEVVTAWEEKNAEHERNEAEFRKKLDRGEVT